MFRQIWIVSALNFKSLKSRFWQSMVIVVGLGATIGVLLSMMSLTAGLRQAYFNSGDPGRAIVTSQGAESEGTSNIARADAPVIMDAPGIAKDKDGRPLADRALNMGLPVLHKNGTKGFTTLRGFGPKGVALRPEFHMVAGRMFQAGKRELIVGVGAQASFQHMNIGDKVIMPNGEWPIVGSYTTGDILDGQLIGDTETMLTALKHTAYNSILVRLTSQDALSTFRKAITTNPALQVTVTRHSDWYQKVSNQSTSFLAVMAYIVGTVMAIGALFGCLNTMYAAVSTRGREIATLRALGYGAFPVAVSVILEAVTLAVVGALIGAAVAWALNDGHQAVWGQNIFHLRVSPAEIGLGVSWAVVVALLGGMLPSIRAARRPVVEALRAT
ncbi:MAG TPA: FtsX-like permease family protein [Rhizomicrobium sp.]|jgi:putative ABC transport system permease protein|nr:FtsX-like permease family protein [Rhizomicrobium sp.]